MKTIPRNFVLPTGALSTYLKREGFQFDESDISAFQVQIESALLLFNSGLIEKSVYNKANEILRQRIFKCIINKENNDGERRSKNGKRSV